MTEITEEQFVSALVRKFRAVEIPAVAGTGNEAEPADSSSSSSTSSSSDPERSRCALCHRTDKLGTGRDDFGRPYCRDAEWDTCNRIAQGRLGASAGRSGNTNALRGELHPDGNCRNCKAPIKWVTTQKGKKMPVDVSPAPPGRDAFELVGRIDTTAFYVSAKRREGLDADLYASHFNSCSRGDD